VFALILEAVLGGVAALLAVPITIFSLEVAAAVSRRRIGFTASGTRPPVAILIPAHNEEAGICATLRSIAPQLAASDRLLVVADNCSDATASVAQAEGAEVVSRTNLEKRGKGFALDFGLQHLKLDAPDIVIMVDADCQVTANAIDQLARTCAAHQRPVQAQYLMRNVAHARLKMRVAEFAWIVKNLVRPLGLAKLHLPCQLMGSGMAFTWSSISKMDLANADIVEDMAMGLELARAGAAPIFCPQALVLSSFPMQEEGIKNQRTRWEHGHLATILRESPGMLLQGVRERDVDLIALALDLCVPPLALLVLQVAATFLAAAVFYVLTGYRAPLLIIGSAALIFGFAVLTAWWAQGRRIVSFSDLLSACMYPLWKIPVYLQFIFSRQSEWVRSKRDKE